MSVLDSLLRADCAETERRLSDYPEGTLPRWRRNRLVRHLTRCEGWPAVLSSLTVAVERLHALGRQSPPSPATVKAVIERIRRDETRETER